MPVAASGILDFLEQRESFTVERHEIASTRFGVLRHSLRQIVLRLRESNDDEALEVSARPRALLSEWLTVPVIFDQSMVDAVRDLFGEVSGVQSRWGSSIWTLYETALRAAESLPSIENPVRERLREVIGGLRAHGRVFKVYCHRRAKPYFESLLVSLGYSEPSEAAFIHSVRDYRETEPFDVLVKVGPLRSRGWGAAPDALLTAPRFDTLVLIVWSGCGNEPGFGYDPARPVTDSLGEGADSTKASRLPIWTEHVNHTGEDAVSAEVDELQIFRETNPAGEKRSAKLIQIDADHGILYPSYSQVLSFDPRSGSPESIVRRIPGETLLEGMFVIRPVTDDVDTGGVQARHGYYSQIWKARLEHEWKDDQSRLVERLKAGGLNLVHLPGAIRHWCKPPGTVIHAPQRIKHFEIVVRVLGLDCDTVKGPGDSDTPWWKHAWNEIRRSRGEAIQAGVLEQELVEEELIRAIRELSPDISSEARAIQAFLLPIPTSGGMKGHLLFFPVCGIEEGFSVPAAQLRIVHELNVIDQWRE